MERDPWQRTRVLYKTFDGQLCSFGPTPENLEKFKTEAEEQGIKILKEKPFLIGEDFTEEEIKWSRAA